MSPTQQSTAAVQEQFLGGVRQSQELVLQAVRTWAEATEKLAGALPAVPARPALPRLGVELPKPQVLMESSFELAEKLLADQRNFTEELFAAAPSFVAKPESTTTATRSSAARATPKSTVSTSTRKTRSSRAKKSSGRKATAKPSSAPVSAGREAKA